MAGRIGYKEKAVGLENRSMAKKQPVTPAIRQLRMLGIAFTEHRFEYREEGGAAAQGARALGVDEYCVVKTLIMEDEHRTPLIVLMHGNRQVSTRQLARCIGVKSIAPCNPVTACRHSGYMIGGTSPFGVRRTMPVFIQGSILELPLIYINGGRRGLLLAMDPGDVQRALQATPVEVAQ